VDDETQDVRRVERTVQERLVFRQVRRAVIGDLGTDVVDQL
jgi:hypothetical protein